MSMEGKFVVPQGLSKGESFSGFNVVESVNKENCHVWVFERNNHAVTVAISYDDYFTLLSNPHERERIMDQMAAEIHTAYRNQSELKFYGNEGDTLQ